MSFSRPLELPEWASNKNIVDPVSNVKNVISPDNSLKPEGWWRNAKPPRQYQNWLANLYYNWIGRYSQIDDIQSHYEKFGFLDGLNLVWENSLSVTLEDGIYWGSNSNKLINLDGENLAGNILTESTPSASFKHFTSINQDDGAVATTLTLTDQIWLSGFIISVGGENPRLGFDTDIFGSNIRLDYADVYSVDNNDIDIRRIGTVHCAKNINGDYLIRKFNIENNGDVLFERTDIGGGTNTLELSGTSSYPYHYSVLETEVINGVPNIGTSKNHIDWIIEFSWGGVMDGSVVESNNRINLFIKSSGNRERLLSFANSNEATNIVGEKTPFGLVEELKFVPSFDVNDTPVLILNAVFVGEIHKIRIKVKTLGYNDPRNDVIN